MSRLGKAILRTILYLLICSTARKRRHIIIIIKKPNKRSKDRLRKGREDDGLQRGVTSQVFCFFLFFFWWVAECQKPVHILTSVVVQWTKLWHPCKAVCVHVILKNPSQIFLCLYFGEKKHLVDTLMLVISQASKIIHFHSLSADVYF